MCSFQLAGLRQRILLLSYIMTVTNAYPMQNWNPYKAVREYPEDDYYYAPKVQYYYDAPAIPAMPELYGQSSYPYYYDPYSHLGTPKGQEERLAALPVGQETWYESDSSPHWRSTNDDDVSATFLDNLILQQMAQDAQRRRENARAAFPSVDYEERDVEDEDVRELKALAGKPLYHVPKTVPRIEEDDYPMDDGFINWNGYKRSITTVAPTSSTTATTARPMQGQKEVVLPRPASTNHHQTHQDKHNKRNNDFYNTIAQLMAKESAKLHSQNTMKQRRIEKRFVGGDSDLVVELRGLKHRIPT